jgi:hypothetical protein
MYKAHLRMTLKNLIRGKHIECPKKIVPFFLFFFLGVQCVESGVSCTDLLLDTPSVD